MKKTLIALTMTAFAATSANAFTLYRDDSTNISLYSSVRVMLAKLENNRPDLLNDGSRFWFNANQKFGDDWSAFGAAQLRPSTQYDDNFSSGFYTHRLYAGLKHQDIGQISFGNQSTMGTKFKVSGFANKFGAITRAGVAYPGSDTYRTYGRTQLGLDTSAKKDIHIETVPINGFTFGADYIFGKKRQYRNYKGKPYSSEKGWQLGVLHYKRIDDFRIKTNVVYAEHRNQFIDYDHRNNPAIHGNIRLKQSLGAGFGVDYKDFNFGIDYIHDKIKLDDGFKNSQTSWQVGAKYYVSYPWDVYAVYRHTKYPKSHATAPNQYVKNNGFAIGTDYKITKRIKTFLEYATNKASNDHETPDRQNGYYAGFRVDF